MNSTGKKALFSLWSLSTETNQKYLALLMKGSCSYKNSDNTDNSKYSDDYNSIKNNDKNINDNDNGNITSLILVNNVFYNKFERKTKLKLNKN